jgi:hypothetical protein
MPPIPFEPTRRHSLGLLAAACCLPLQAAEGEALPPALAFLGFEVIDDQPDPARWPALRERAERIGRQMSEGLDRRGLYRVSDLAPAQGAIAQARDANEYLHRCNGCLGEVGAAAGAQLVGVGWVQRVSNLILNLNLGIWDVRDDRMVLTKSVDIRGDNDESWRRGIDYMLRDMVERRARQPRYGM